jgi:hypothetical protein
VLGQLNRSGIGKRLQKLEAVTDDSRLAPHSQKWLEYWDQQYYRFLTGQDRNAIRQSPIAAYRAVMHYADNPASLVGSIPSEDSNHYAGD